MLSTDSTKSVDQPQIPQNEANIWILGPRENDVPKNKVPKSRFWDVGMEFRDEGCVRIPFAMNSKPFSTHSN